MPRYKKKRRYKKKSPVGTIVLVAVAVILVAVFVLFAMPRILYSQNGGADAGQLESGAENSQGDLTDETSTPENGVNAGDSGDEIAFPILLENGNLEIESLFPFSGINPDCENLKGDNIASITVKNISPTYLKEAEIHLLLQDGTVLRFAVTDVPAGKAAMAFSVDNLEIGMDAVCLEASCEAVFGDPDAVDEKVSVTVDGIQVTLVNTSGEDLSEIVVYCHDLFDMNYFGGITYPYVIHHLAAGESATVDATNCVFGAAEVVRVAINDYE